MTRMADYPDGDARRWAGVDAYFAQVLGAEDPVVRAVLAANQQAALPAADVSPLQGRFLELLVRMTQARRVLEIGTLGAYSTIHMARALPDDGKVVTIEADPRHVEVARLNVTAACLQERVDLREGRALDVLPTLSGPFDLIFIDADKSNNPSYLQWALALSRPGTVIVGDNVVRGGQVVDAESVDANVQGIRRFVDLVAANRRLTATVLQTVGEKGWDGFLLAHVGEARKTDDG